MNDDNMFPTFRKIGFHIQEATDQRRLFPYEIRKKKQSHSIVPYIVIMLFLAFVFYEMYHYLIGGI